MLISYPLTAATDVGDCVLDQPRALGGNEQTDPQVDKELFPEGELLLQVSFCISVIWGLPLAPAIHWA